MKRSRASRGPNESAKPSGSPPASKCGNEAAMSGPYRGGVSTQTYAEQIQATIARIDAVVAAMDEPGA